MKTCSREQEAAIAHQQRCFNVLWSSQNPISNQYCKYLTIAVHCTCKMEGKNEYIWIYTVHALYGKTEYTNVANWGYPVSNNRLPGASEEKYADYQLVWKH